MILRSALCLAVLGATSLPLTTRVADAAPALPTLAVYTFDTRGITPWWNSNFDPGAALADLLSDRLVNRGAVTVIDRDHLQQVLQEQNLARGGDVTPATEARLGRMLGVGYLLVGKIVEFDKASNGTGGLGSHILGGLGGGALASTKITLEASVKVIEASSGRIVAALDDEQSATSTSFAVGGVGGSGAGAYTSPDFQKSAMGKLLGSVADDLETKIDPTKLAATAPAPTVSGKIITSADGDFILNVGSDNGVQNGMMFDTFDVKHVIDPDTNKSLTSEIPGGTVQVISVSKDSAVAKKVSGTVRARQTVKSE